MTQATLIRQPGERAHRADRAARRGVASAQPPAYGIDYVDRALAAAGSPTSAAAVVQRYSSQTYTIGSQSVAGTLSENGVYFLPGGPIQSARVFATSAPSHCAKLGTATYTFNAKSYAQYAPSAKFLDDCLHTAEEIVNNKILGYGTGVYSKEKGTGTAFGESDKDNIAVAAAAKKASSKSVDAGADPSAGEAFVIVDNDFVSKPSKRSPYHAAGVVGADGKDRLTMEVFAGGGSLEKRETDAKMSMYTVDGGKESFHGYWSAGYFGKYATTTIVIQAK